MKRYDKGKTLKYIQTLKYNLRFFEQRMLWYDLSINRSVISLFSRHTHGRCQDRIEWNMNIFIKTLLNFIFFLSFFENFIFIINEIDFLKQIKRCIASTSFQNRNRYHIAYEIVGSSNNLFANTQKWLFIFEMSF